MNRDEAEMTERMLRRFGLPGTAEPVEAADGSWGIYEREGASRRDITAEVLTQLQALVEPAEAGTSVLEAHRPRPVRGFIFPAAR